MNRYSVAEEIVLRHFFTNTEHDVYCATDAMPTALWAFLEGGYSRSQQSMRDRFLTIFAEMRAKDKTAPTIEDLADAVSSGGLRLEGALEKASGFMSKWAVEYGHNSLKDSSIDRFALENVSQRAAKLLEHSSLGAFQEKSTRYLDFSRDEFTFPETLLNSRFGEEARWQATLLMKAYRELLASMTSHFLSTLPKSEFRSEAAWKRTANAKAFDVSRYLLPCSVRTSVGATFPTRETERHISHLLASPYSEVRDLALRMRQESVRINPGLLRHVEANPYLERTRGPLADLAKSLTTPSTETRFGARLTWITPDIEDLGLASALVATEQHSCGLDSWLETLRAGGSALKHKVAKAALEGRGRHDEWPKEFAVGQIGFDLVLDFGAWRDLQRHRVGLTLRARPMASLGYSLPVELESPALGAVADLYRRAMDRASEFHSRVVQELPWDADYTAALGHHCAWTYACDLRQWAYLVELRSGPSGHVSYRRLAQQMAKAVLPYAPHLKPYLRVDWSGPDADRRQAEERTQEKISALATA